MTLGEHCDEIVRLIDETLGTLGIPSTSRRGAPLPPLDGSLATTDLTAACTDAPSDLPTRAPSARASSNPAGSGPAVGATGFAAVPSSGH